MKLRVHKVYFILTLFAILTNCQQVFSQKKVHRCATMDALEERLRTDPAFKADYEAKNRDLDAYLAAHPLQPTIDAFPSDTIIVPVVVHIVVPDPYRITDENVQFFIDRLNEDFSGFNADSATGSSWYGVRGHSMIRFTLARRDPNGKSTTGIERKVGNIQIATTTAQNIKSVASGGLAAWNTSTYYNLWVGSGFSTTGLLGISPGIGPGATSGTGADGVCVDEQVFANNPCYTDPSFALARTAVHEIGHNFGLYHTFQGGCSSADFTTNLSSGTLPAAYLGPLDDTPPLSTSTSGCPTDGTTNGCSPAVPKMFQNYMDYSDDGCMSLFTLGQVKRMHQVVTQFRSGYLTTQGYLPPVGTPANETGIVEVISPGGSEYNQASCNTRTYSTPFCGINPTITPKVKIANYGVNVLTSVTLNAMINGSVVASQTFSVNVTGGGIRTATLSLPTISLVNGTNIVKIFTTNPNGSPDGAPANDTITKTIVIDNTPPAVTTLPHTEGFEVGNFNPTASGWKIINGSTATSTTWTRTTATAKTGTGSAMIKFFGYTPVGDVDYLYSPRLNFNNTTDSVFIAFNYAYKRKSTAAASLKDTLSVEVTTDCDPSTANWTSLWKKGGTTLATTTATTTTTWTPTAAEWTTTPIKVSLLNYVNGPIYVAFKAKNGNGQNLYIDDINIYSVANPLPVKLVSFTAIQNNKKVTCKWETKQEEGIKNYSVERSVDGKTFESIGLVDALGNSTNAGFYQFTDVNAFNINAATLYYRLKINDVNGKFNYSSVVVVSLGEKQSVQLYPNPTKDFVNVQINSSSNSAINNTIEVIDYLGKVVLSKKVTVTTGTQNIALNTTNLPKANYVVVIKNESEFKTLKFTKE